MRKRFMVGVLALAALATSGVVGGEALKSGPQVGKKVGAFHPLNVTGAHANERFCQV